MSYYTVRLDVFQAAESQEPPTWAIFRQAQIESNFNPDAVSDLKEDPAIGVFQIRPSTAAQPGFGVTPVTRAALIDPAAATVFACRYLAGMKNHFPGGWSMAFLKYNVGPGGDVHTASDAYKRLAQYVAWVEDEPDPLA